MDSILFIPDTHVPYVDKRAFDLMLKVARDVKVSTIVYLGDFGDFYAVSSHDKDPSRKVSFMEELRIVNQYMDKVDALKAKRTYFVEGNHEFRLKRFMAAQAPAVADLVTLEQVLRFKERGYRYTPYREFLRLGKLNITHDVGKSGPNAIRDAQAMFEGNVVAGHTHRMQALYAGNAQGKSHVGMSFGWLGDRNSVDYMHKVVSNRTWQLGFGLGYMESNGVVHLVPCPIVDYKVVVNGKLYK